MRKYRCPILICLIIVTVIVSVFALKRIGKSTATLENQNGTTCVNIKVGNNHQVITPWYSEVDDKYYYFIPAFLKDDFNENTTEKILVDGTEKEASFICSENIDSLFISTESGDNAYILADKENEESGTLQAVTPKGKTQFLGKLDKINGRGNATWSLEEKKPFSLSLEEGASLCGLKSGRKYALHAMCYEGDKLHTKFIYDMEKELGMDDSSGSTWVDVYLNGEYFGLYLLEESHKVSADRIDLPNNAFMVTHTSKDRVGDGPYFFLDDGEDTFTIEYPKDPKEEKFSEIEGVIKGVDIAIHQGDFSYVDMDTFANNYLADEISMNYDAFTNSSFFYQRWEGDALHAGPVWDYDLSFGENNTTNTDFADTSLSIVGLRGAQLDWYSILLQDDEFRKIVAGKIEGMLPWYRKMLEETIDEQADKIEKSVAIDMLRWSNKPQMTAANDETIGSYIKVSEGSASYTHPGGSYKEYKNNVRYFKYFLANRLNYLMDEFGVEGKRFAVEKFDSNHTVIFKKRGEVVQQLQVKDGELIPEFPDQFLEDDETWRMSWCMDIYCEYLPVYEDMVLRSIKE